MFDSECVDVVNTALVNLTVQLCEEGYKGGGGGCISSHVEND